MKMLVTGGAGFLGSRLCAAGVSGGGAVACYDSLFHRDREASWLDPRVEFIRADVRDVATFTDAARGADVVVHLAAIVGEPSCKQYPEEAKSINLDCVPALLEAARRSGVRRFIFISTCSNYGVVNAGDIANEGSRLSPLSLYAETKIDAERLVRDANTLGFTCVVLRLATLFGESPRMRMDLLVHEYVREALVHRRIGIYGPDSWRPIVHVQDAARAILQIADASATDVAGQVFNVGGDELNVQKKEMAALVAGLCGDVPIDVSAGKRDPRDYRVSFEKIRTVLRFVPTRTLADGIVEVRDAIVQGRITDPYDRVYGYA